MSGDGKAPPGPVEDPQARVADLATGFALNELTDDELRELHRHLVASDTGREAARTAWRTLETVTDLRAERSSTLQDTVRSRIDETSRATGVTGRFLRRLGLRRGSLAPVMDGDRPPVPRWPLAVAALLLPASAIAGWWLLRADPVARVESVVGRATIAGASLGPGDALDSRPAAVAADSVLALRWRDGSRLALIGPGTLTPQPTGVALMGGILHGTAAARLTIGLPDGTAEVDAGSRLAIEVVDGHSAIGVETGRVRIGGTEIGPGATWADGASGPWLEQTLDAVPARLPVDGARRWRMAFTAAPVEDGRLLLTWDDGSLRIDRNGIAVLRPDGGMVRAVRPPGTAEVVIDATPASWTITLLGETLLTGQRPPARISAGVDGKVPVTVRYRNGPAK